MQVAAAITHRILFNTTLAVSSLIGPLEEISFYGHPMAYLAPSVYGHPQVSHPNVFDIQIVSNLNRKYEKIFIKLTYLNKFWIVHLPIQVKVSVIAIFLYLLFELLAI